MIARNVPAIDAAEKAVNTAWAVWLAGRPTPCTAHPAHPKKRHRRR